MASWDPVVADVTGHVPAWAHAATDAIVVPLITQSVNEVTGEVPDFNSETVINPAAPEADQITLGDLARNAAALRAADLWASGIGPEMDAVDNVRADLFVKYQRALASLRRHVDRLTTHRRRIIGSVRVVR